MTSTLATCYWLRHLLNNTPGLCLIFVDIFICPQPQMLDYHISYCFLRGLALRTFLVFNSTQGFLRPLLWQALALTLTSFSLKCDSGHLSGLLLRHGLALFGTACFHISSLMSYFTPCPPSTESANPSTAEKSEGPATCITFLCTDM